MSAQLERSIEVDAFPDLICDARPNASIFNMVACIKAVQEFRMRGRILSENNHTMGPLVYQPLPHGQQAKRAPRARPTRVCTHHRAPASVRQPPPNISIAEIALEFASLLISVALLELTILQIIHIIDVHANDHAYRQPPPLRLRRPNGTSW